MKELQMLGLLLQAIESAKEKGAFSDLTWESLGQLAYSVDWHKRKLAALAELEKQSDAKTVKSEQAKDAKAASDVAQQTQQSAGKAA